MAVRGREGSPGESSDGSDLLSRQMFRRGLLRRDISRASIASASTPTRNFCYTGMTHKASAPFEDGTFDGDENAIVDFKYSSSPLLTWWFDHHQSAFLKPEDAEHFRHDRSGKNSTIPPINPARSFSRPSLPKNSDLTPGRSRTSSSGAISSMARNSLRPEEAVGLAEPAMQLALVIEAAPEPNLVPQIDPRIGRNIA